MSGTGFTDYEAIIRVLDGTKLSNSNYSTDAVSALLRDTATNSLEAHAPIFLKGEPEQGMRKVLDAVKDLPPGTKVILLAGAVVVIGGTVVVTKNWDTIKSLPRKLVTKLRRRSDSNPDDLTGDLLNHSKARITPHATATDVEVTDNLSEVTLTSEQWRQLVRGAIELGSWEEQIWLLLANAAIEGSDQDVLDVQREMKAVDPSEVSSKARELLAKHPAMRDSDQAPQLLRELLRRLDDSDGTPDAITH